MAPCSEFWAGWGACGWSVVQLDHEELVPMHARHGTLDAELEVQRTIKRAELTAFWCLFWKAIGPTTAHSDNKGIIDGLWPNIEGRRLLYLGLGRIVQSSLGRHTGGSRTRRK